MVAAKEPSVSFYPFVVAAWLLLIGLYGIVTSRNLIHLVVCLQVVQASTYVLLLSIGFRHGAAGAGLRRRARSARRPSTRSCRRWRSPTSSSAPRCRRCCSRWRCRSTSARTRSTRASFARLQGLTAIEPIWRRSPSSCPLLGAAAAGRRCRGDRPPRRRRGRHWRRGRGRASSVRARARGRDRRPVVYWFGGWPPRGGVVLGVVVRHRPDRCRHGAVRLRCCS